MKTTHQIIFGNAKDMSAIPSGSVALVVTSPPYPMIEMWDKMFAEQNPEIKEALSKRRGPEAFELMHKELDPVWDEVYRVLSIGGIACINVGDATRTLGGNFVLYPNHSRILSHLTEIGVSALPEILWRKQTNAPNKFMGSGMLPPGAYVTLEHEFILIVRKGPKRDLSRSDQKLNRQESAFFWEERNVWYSDVWMDLKGTTQDLNNDETRSRSAAYRFEVPYRLINMFSVKGDRVLDPFCGIGTTMIAAMAACRNSVGFELEEVFREIILSRTANVVAFSNEHIGNRIQDHLNFVKNRLETKGMFKHRNRYYGFPVMTRQETGLFLNELASVGEIRENTFEVTYTKKPDELSS